jgi:hypothetical protein
VLNSCKLRHHKGEAEVMEFGDTDKGTCTALLGVYPNPDLSGSPGG